MVFAIFANQMSCSFLISAIGSAPAQVKATGCENLALLFFPQQHLLSATYKKTKNNVFAILMKTSTHDISYFFPSFSGGSGPEL